MTLEQYRVKLAWDVTSAYATDDGRKAAWKTAIMGFGTNVHRCGLLQAVAFLRRDEEQIYSALGVVLDTHLRQRGFLAGQTNADLMTTVGALSAMDYMLVSREVLAVSVWLKRAAQILCPSVDG